MVETEVRKQHKKKEMDAIKGSLVFPVFRGIIVLVQK